MSYVRIWVHIVFSTKYHIPFLTPEIKEKVQLHVMENCKKKGIFLQAINGYSDHLHCLISLENQQKFKNEKFQWQEEYYAVSVGESQLAAVIRYIKNQEVHHQTNSLDREMKTFKKG